jgi:hypothetical protein
MDKNILIARVRQILALDKNASELYADLAKNSEKRFSQAFAQIARDEKRHIALSLKIISLLEKG